MTDEITEGPPVAPVVAVVGRPNVGKSTLVNRILGRREAVVQDIPGVTRDRVAYDALWNGRRFTLVDTGGWEPDSQGLQAMVSAQAERAVATADLVLFVVDGRTGATDTDLTVARTLRRAKRPVVLAVTKVDDERLEPDTAELWSLGLGEPFPVSGLHGRGSGDLLDAVLARLPDAPPDTDEEGGPRRVALVGRPNVGKSSLLNRLTGEARSVVDSVAGTTIDPVDSLVELGGEVWRFVDTAGLRRRVHQASGMEYYASLRTAAAIEAAEVAVVLLDASDRLSEQDQRVIAEVVDAGRALVLAFNKWDLVDEDRRELLTKEVARDLARVAWAPRVNVSARTGRAVDKLAAALHTSLGSWDRRISTGRLNTWLSEVVAQTPPPPRGGKAPRVLFATQADTRPPRFVLFTTGFLEAGYRRFIERRLREDFDFTGTPIEISIRVREKRQR
ncbi:MAG: GTPase [Pseudonocardiales bacterium]|jgi:GTP-binding protein|nr:GTPase [Pseudonocardiales bacterium]